MVTRLRKEGFTLVEMAIVLTIIGLVIGGILKGQQMIKTAKIDATIAEVHAIDTATTAFRDAYGALPGDMVGADLKIPNCGSGAGGACDTSQEGSGPSGPYGGDGIIGRTTAFLPAGLQVTQVQAPNQPSPSYLYEPTLFWVMLNHAGFINNVSDDGITAGSMLSYGGEVFYGGGLTGSNPSAPVGGGFFAETISPTSAGIGSIIAGRTGRPVDPVSGTYKMNVTGLALILGAKGTTNIGMTWIVNGNTTYPPLLTPGQAAQFDRKIDDGNPYTGTVEAISAYGYVAPGGNSTNSDCFNTNPASGGAPTGSYNEEVTVPECSLIFGIQQ